MKRGGRHYRAKPIGWGESKHRNARIERFQAKHPGTKKKAKKK